MTAFIDLTGLTIGRWTVIARDGARRWHCRCSCGTEKSIYRTALRAGTSLGCRECRPFTTKHAESRTRLYAIWAKMISRCENQNEPTYPYYGGRGITVCREWRVSYETFRDWANEHGYQADLTLDRVDNNDGYRPDNCRWATMQTQSRNRRSNRILSYNGRDYSQAELAEKSGLKYGTFARRIRLGWSVERAISEPLRSIQS